MNFRNGVFKTNLFTSIKESKYNVKIECKSKYQRELLVLLYDFIRNIKSDNMYIVIREFQSVISNIDIDHYRFEGCKISIRANNIMEDLYVPVI